MGTTWFREVIGRSDYAVGSGWLCAIPNGSTYNRIRWSWGFTGVTSDIVDVAAVAGNLLVAGLVTTFGNGTETPPNPVSASSDADPPTLRWLWWETRAPVITAASHGAGIIGWRDSGSQEIPDVKSQVKATGVPGGDTLNLWFSYASAIGAGWDPSGSVQIWVSASCLFSTP